MEIGELTAVSVDSVLKHGPDCPFCKSNKPPKTPVSKAGPDPDDDSGLIGNDSGELDQKMGAAGDHRPKNWHINIKNIGGSESHHNVVPNPHHLIPGNESLKKSDLLKWIFGDKGTIQNDIGYNVNNDENGIWLPSNNGMRGKTLWTDLKFKAKYVVLAMDRSGGHFHDRHNSPYSDSVTKILNTIADRMDGIDAKANCPFKTEEAGGKYKPPYALVGRLNGVSGRIRGYLEAAAKPQASFYTSKLVLYYWISKTMATDKAGVLK